MVKKRVTMADVAKAAGVSRTTVSFVLNNLPTSNIPESTRQRVLQAARDLDYTPNEVARSLVSGQTRNIGFVICQPPHQILADAYLPHVIYGVNEITHELGFRLLLDWVEDVTQPDAYINVARAKKIDGILLCGPRSDDTQLPRLIDDGFPVVLLGTLPETTASFVDVDNCAAARVATDHLIDLGHRRIACITNAPLHYTGSAERVRGYQMALTEAGIEVDSALIRFGNFNPESGYQAMKSILTETPFPTAVFVASDVVAFGAMAAVRERGLHIPDDIAVVGFDDVSMSRYVDPPLTTIRLPAIEQGIKAITILLDLIQGKRPAKSQLFLDVELIIRQSCGAR